MSQKEEEQLPLPNKAPAKETFSSELYVAPFASLSLSRLYSKRLPSIPLLLSFGNACTDLRSCFFRLCAWSSPYTFFYHLMQFPHLERHLVLLRHLSRHGILEQDRLDKRFPLPFVPDVGSARYRSRPLLGGW